MSYQDGYEMGRRDAYHNVPARWINGRDAFTLGYLAGYNS